MEELGVALDLFLDGLASWSMCDQDKRLHRILNAPGVASGADRFSAHLFPHHPLGHFPPLDLEQGLRIDPSEEVQEGGDQAGPAGLMAGPEPRAVVAVEEYS